MVRCSGASSERLQTKDLPVTLSPVPALGLSLRSATSRGEVGEAEGIGDNLVNLTCCAASGMAAI